MTDLLLLFFIIIKYCVDNDECVYEHELKQCHKLLELIMFFLLLFELMEFDGLHKYILQCGQSRQQTEKSNWKIFSGSKLSDTL